MKRVRANAEDVVHGGESCTPALAPQSLDIDGTHINNSRDGTIKGAPLGTPSIESASFTETDDVHSSASASTVWSRKSLDTSESISVAKARISDRL